ncbi:MAG: hypothetical protein J6K31_01920 [Parabacteroides sp.]|nr:hypothetical protein [Parabacteroides sp.]
MRKVLFVTFILFALFTQVLFAQTKKVQAKGDWEIANITPEAARSKAIEVAKNNALRAAGISELFTVINTNSISDRLSYFVSSSYSELSGEITNYKITDEQILTDEKHLFYTVNIEAIIQLRKNKRDLEFDACIEGIKETPYQNGENFLFNIRPTKACYTHIFWFDEAGIGNIVYPNPAEPSQLLRSNEANYFPITQDYKIRKETQEPIESISVIFVLTKKDIPYTRKITLEDFHQWVLSIPSDQRVIKFHNIHITY